MSDGLEDCPFCGGGAVVSGDMSVHCAATCEACGATVDATSVTDAVSKWNRRAADLAQAPAPVRVKPLVWEVCALPRHHENKWVAGPYTIRFVEDFFLVYGWDDKFKHTSVDLDDAQAAAQADYETRILSAIEWSGPDA